MEFSGENVLVTGGAGFIGSGLVRTLLKENANVVVIDNLLIGSLDNLHEVMDQITFIEKNVKDPSIEQILEKHKVKYVFHLAAEPYIPYSYERPAEFLDVNIMATLNLLIACKRAKVKRILYYSTSEVYGSAKYIPMDETHLLNPHSTYAVSKMAADRLCFTFHHEHYVPVIILRQFNVYGPRETQPYIIPELISQASRSDKFTLGNIEAKRDFTYVDDATSAAIELMKYEEAEGDLFNCGTGKSYSIKEIARMITQILGKSMEITIDKSRLRPLDVNVLQANYEKLHQLTGWKPVTDIYEGLKKTIGSFVQNGKMWLWEKKIAPEERIWEQK